MTTDHGMTNADAEERPDELAEDAPSSALEVPTRTARLAQGARNAVDVARTGIVTIAGRAPGTARATRTAARRTTGALQRLPDSTLRWLAAGSIGLAAGLRLAGAPRLVTAAGTAPALLVGAAIALRPTKPGVPVEDHAEEAVGGMPDMTDEHTKGAITKAQGTIEEGLGTLAGDEDAQFHGKAKQVQGEAQQGLGDVQNALRKPGKKEMVGA